ncbi:MAG TPA: bifunctional diaminohydroxyphosphoribosylaminopyrimidine deaminase/5-amino-6-(5-phosphoribosylamino)uracil reductase RibD [Verrucomicrobiota bacterium]|nr:bifunctional diaminohydroxyphosphoribosylaminopyrimidine deaminase/5-amino-6-(5-phosphoribosylamino)uracil reductase RibD [Verrucomicrobiota bacterium]HNT14118.1 bifunctional diaminohydroxyphosphoribosylaminopyrimidine deaminase/5-amino-6-(5-phosphoribosylamino)uracil reductase RibD [Verrucomicrobiota bacterium]
MRQAIRLAQRGRGTTSPNPIVGALLVRAGRIIGRGWHRRAGEPHAEIEAFRDAGRRRHSVRGATLYVTLEPCSTHGRTPPCTAAIQAAGIRRVVVGAIDPNPRHAGAGLSELRHAGLQVAAGVLSDRCAELNEAFNHWIQCRTPLVTVKAAMTLDGKIATAAGESKWITSAAARAHGMQLRHEHDAIVVGVHTILADDPSLVVRKIGGRDLPEKHPPLRRIVLDAEARTPLSAKVVSDPQAATTTLVVSENAAPRRVAALARRVRVVTGPAQHGKIDLRWLLRKLGAEAVTSLLVEGGGEVNASFLLERLAQRIAFFYAPKILGGRTALKGVAGKGAEAWSEVLTLTNVNWRLAGEDLLLTARVAV